MDVRAIRDRFGSNPPSGVHGHPRPPHSVAEFPALIVLDPVGVTYRSSYGGRPLVLLPLQLLAGHAPDNDGSGALDDLVSALPAHVHALAPAGLWREAEIVELEGGYTIWQQRGETVAVAATLIAHIVI